MKYIDFNQKKDKKIYHLTLKYIFIFANIPIL